MRPIFVVPLLIFFVLFSLFSADMVKAGETCKEGDRRVCGFDVGICESGRSICRDGKWVICEGMVNPQEIDVCGNGLDDDCNGLIDDNCFPWISLVLVGTGIFFIGLGFYYMKRESGERMLREGIGKD